ncbi:GFA family protein [bacterium]|jgi:hypothetical protein|nr:GFA family protein [bacterium]
MPGSSVIYEGKCHCGQIQFRIKSEPIQTGVRCNCSICRRKNAVMSGGYYPPENFQLISGAESLSNYQFEPNMVNHYFCKHCGNYPFHDGTDNPGTFRVNLGCIDEIDLEALKIRIFDGKETWKFLDDPLIG